jgi:trimeric autotransporter adhesin
MERSMLSRPFARSLSLLSLLALGACAGVTDSTGSAVGDRVAALSVDRPTLSFAGVGAAQTLTVTARSASGASLSSPTVIWTSDQPSIATVVGSGTTATVSALARGSTTIRAQSGSASLAVPVTIRGVVAITIATPAAALRQGDTLTLRATVQADADVPTAVTWTSRNADVATISANGVVTALTPGATTFVATAVGDPSVSARLDVNVLPLRTLVLRPDTLRLARLASQPVTATLVVESGVATTLRFRSTDPSIATVSAAGVVAGVGPGRTSIVAIAEGDTTLRATAVVIVSPIVTGVTVSPTAAQLIPAETAQLRATVRGDAGVDTTVRWRSSQPSVVTVSPQGIATGVAPGTATITATSVADSTRTASTALTVVTGPPRLAARWDVARINGAMVEDITGVWCPRANSCFAIAGTTGELYRAEGSEWRALPRVGTSTQRLQSISGNAAGTAAIAVGTGGLIARFDGAQWSTMTSGVSSDLLSVSMMTDSDVLAVGSGGVVLRSNGSSWARLTSPAGSTTLLDVASTGSGWFVTGDDGIVLRLNADQSWSRFVAPTNNALRGVAAASPTSAVAVGEFGTIVQVSGTAVTRVESGVNVALNDVALSTSGQWTAVGDGVSLRSTNGTGWQSLAAPYTTRLLTAYTDPTGALVIGGQRGVVMEQRGGTWTTRNAAPDLLDVWTVDASTAWAVGELGFIHRWNGTSWSRQSAPTTQRLNSVWAPTPTLAFAVGDSGTLLRTIDGGTTWNAQLSPTSSDIIGVWGISATVAYAVGAGGELLLWDGVRWTITGATAPAALYSVFGTSITDIWAVGDAGMVYRSAGGPFARQQMSTVGLLTGIWAQHGANVYAVGQSDDRALMLQWDGTRWQSVAPGTTNVLSSIWGPNAQDLYATGANGTLVRFDGTRWSAMTSGTTDFLWSISGTTDGRGGLAVGFNSTVLTAVRNGASSSTAAQRVRAHTTHFEPDPRATRGNRVLPVGRARRVIVQ